MFVNTQINLDQTPLKHKSADTRGSAVLIDGSKYVVTERVA